MRKLICSRENGILSANVTKPRKNWCNMLGADDGTLNGMARAASAQEEDYASLAQE